MRKILWVCKESFTGLVNFSIPYFMDYYNAAVFIHPTESLLKDRTYTNFKEANQTVKIHTLDELAKTYSSNIQRRKISFDTAKIIEFEKKYCNKLPWGVLLMSSQIFTTPYHYRFFFKDISDNEKNYWVQLLFEYFEQLLEEDKPDYIFDFDNSEIGRSVLWLVADYLNIPYICIEHTRYQGYKIPNFNLGRGIDKYILNYYKRIRTNKILDQINEIKNYKQQESIMVKDFEYNKTAKKTNNSLIEDILKLIRSEITAFKKVISKISILGIKFRFPFIAKYPQTGIFFLMSIIKERYLLSRFNYFFSNPIPEEKYVYFPLHLIPESTTLIKAPFYPNEEEIIRAIAKSLPVGWKLYIKEHGAMIGERPLIFYKQIKRLSNVKLLKLDSHPDPKNWILNSMGVITIAGTTAFEAVMLGKPAIVFGGVPFGMVEGVEKCSNFEELPILIKRHFVEWQSNTTESCAKYIKTVNKFGQPIKFTFLHNSCLNSLVNNLQISDEAKAEIQKLSTVLKTGIDILEQRI